MRPACGVRHAVTGRFVMSSAGVRVAVGGGSPGAATSLLIAMIAMIALIAIRAGHLRRRGVRVRVDVSPPTGLPDLAGPAAGPARCGGALGPGHRDQCRMDAVAGDGDHRDPVP